MEKNQRDAFTTLLGGMGVIVLLIGIFTWWLRFEEAIIIAVAFWVLAGVAGSMQSDSFDMNLKRGVVAFLGGAGLVVLFIGIFTWWLDFETALIIAVSIWVVTGALAAYTGIDGKSPTLQDRIYYQASPAPVQIESSPAYYKAVSDAPAKIKSTNKYCRHCGYQVDAGSKFCYNCGTKIQ